MVSGNPVRDLRTAVDHLPQQERRRETLSQPEPNFNAPVVVEIVSEDPD